ncbi:MAG TPA: hypothetical protein DEA96_08405 [Leptospiraceae bacterium]|nr:hypothetical protein [Leptospiraceae bacterium]
MNIQSPKMKPALLALAMVLALGAFDGLRAEDRALVTRLVGVARVQKGGQGEFQNLKLRQIIQSKDKIQTGPQSNLVIIYQGKEIRLGPKTEVTLENLNSKKEPLQVKLKKGFTWIDVKKLNNQGVEVVSPTAVASVRGTKFSVSHDEHGSATCVC